MAVVWPPILPTLKADLDVTDASRDAVLQTQLDAAVAFVQKKRGGQDVGNVNFTGLVNANTADLTTLQTLTGVDATLAQTIIDGRPYHTLNQLRWVVDGPFCTTTSVFNGFADQVTLAADPDSSLVLGTIRLAGRWYTRRRAPDDLIAAAELGTVRLPGLDPDITRLLRLGRHQSMVVG